MDTARVLVVRLVRAEGLGAERKLAAPTPPPPSPALESQAAFCGPPVAFYLGNELSSPLVGIMQTMDTSPHWPVRRISLAFALVAVLTAVIFGLSTWWSHGKTEDLKAWAQAKKETAWLVAILVPEAERPTPRCADSTKIADWGGQVVSGNSARGISSIREAQSRLLHEGWSLLRREKLDNGDGLGPRQFDSFERKFSGRTVRVTLVGSEQVRGPVAVHRAALDPPGVTIIMEPKFCGV